MPLWATCDVFAPGIALGHVIGRLGCLLAGCCYGKPTNVPWAITFTDPFAAANVGTPLNVPLHPTQVYEAGAELLILIFLIVTERKWRPYPGRTFWGYMLLYAISRFIIEFYRADERGFVVGLSTSQFISVVLAPLSLVHAVLPAAPAGARPSESRKARGMSAAARGEGVPASGANGAGRGGPRDKSCPARISRRGGRPHRSLSDRRAPSGTSRSQIQRLIKDGKVTIAGQAVPANRIVRAG